MKKMLIWFGLVLVFWTMLAAEENTKNTPEIQAFKITQLGNLAKVKFSFANVAGGLEAAEWVISWSLTRGDKLAGGFSWGFKLRPNESVIILKENKGASEGEFEALIPLHSEGLIPGDRIKYSLFLVDKEGRKSNTAEFEFVVGWNI